MVPTLPIKFTTVNTVKLLTRTLAYILSYTEFAKLYFITSLWILEDMPGVLYRILSGAMLSIKTKGDYVSPRRVRRHTVFALVVCPSVCLSQNRVCSVTQKTV